MSGDLMKTAPELAISRTGGRSVKVHSGRSPSDFPGVAATPPYGVADSVGGGLSTPLCPLAPNFQHTLDNVRCLRSGLFPRYEQVRVRGIT